MADTIMIVGYFGPRFIAEGIAEGFEQKGCKVIRISAEPCAPTRIERKIPNTDTIIVRDPGKFDLHVMDDYAKRRIHGSNHEILTEASKLQLNLRRLRLRDYTDRFPCNKIFFIQNMYSWDFENVTTPLYYYHTDIISTNLPLHAERITGFFYAYEDAYDEMKDSHPYEAQHWHWNKFITYGFSPHLHTLANNDWQSRPIFCGFMGSTAQNNRSKNGLRAHIYDNRNNVLKELHSFLKQDFVFQKMGTPEDYVAFLHQCKIAVNVPGTYGKWNQRQFEIPACGALLLQWDYPELKDLGFITGVNCLTFTDINSMFDQLNFVTYNPAEADKIRLAGIKLVYDNHHTYQDRGQQFYDRIVRELTVEEKERVAYIEYEKRKERDPELKEEYLVQMLRVGQ